MYTTKEKLKEDISVLQATMEVAKGKLKENKEKFESIMKTLKKWNIEMAKNEAELKKYEEEVSKLNEELQQSNEV